MTLRYSNGSCRYAKQHLMNDSLVKCIQEEKTSTLHPAPHSDILRKPYDYTFEITKKYTHYTELSIAHELSTKCRERPSHTAIQNHIFSIPQFFLVKEKYALTLGVTV